MIDSNLKHALVAKITHEGEEHNLLFITLESEPTPDIIEYFHEQLRTDPELGLTRNETGIDISMDFTLHIATPEEIKSFIESQIENPLPENEQ